MSPAISAHKFLIFKYDLNSSSDNNDLLIDYVHLRRQGEICELKALVFSAADFANTETHANVAIKVIEGTHCIRECLCSLCPGEGEWVMVTCLPFY